MGNVTNDLGSFAAEVDAKKAVSDVRTTLQEVRDVIEDDEWPQEMSHRIHGWRGWSGRRN